MIFFGNGREKRITAMALVISMLTAFPTGTGAVTKKQLEGQKDTAEKQLEQANENVSEIEDERSSAAAEAEEIDQQLVQLLATIDILDDEISAKKQDVEISSQDYDRASQEEKRQYDDMKGRIKFMYEQGNTQYFEILMQSKSFADAVNKADYVEKVYDYDREMLERYDETVRETRAIHDRLVEEEAELEGMQLEFKEQQSELERTLTEKKAVVENFDEKLAAARAEARKYEKQVKDVNTEIARVAAKEKAEREAREKAEREAKERAEKEARAKKEKEKEEKSAGEEGTYDESSQEGKYGKDKTGEEPAYDESSQEGEYAKNDSGEEGTYNEDSQEGEYKKDTDSGGSSAGSGAVEVSGSGTGADIAAYGCKFIGNPYVSGGTSLTNGCDCSGFTFSVFAHFGYSIPRTSSEQLSCGRGVSYSEAKAGDLICYAGHVGIYIGNGMIVHASTPATGIKTTVATYRPILAVRRVV